MIDNKYMVIDFHAHVYPEKIAWKAVSGTANFYDKPASGKGTIEDLLSYDSGIDKFLIHSSATSPQQVDAINTFIYESVISQKDKFIGFGTIHPDTPNKEEVIIKIKSLGLKGIKMHPDIQRVAIDDPRNLEIYKYCEKHGLIVLLHTGDKRYDYSNYNRLIPLCRKFEKLKFVGAHFGGYTMWEEAAINLSGINNLYVDCSSSAEFTSVELVNKLIKIYGADKVLFGTDYPLNDPVESLRLFSMLDLTDEDRKKILYRNACDLLGLC